MVEKTGLFGRSSRILKSQDFVRVSRKGQRRASSEFVLLSVIEPNCPGRSTADPRLGLSTSRAVGNAVVRNRIRRQVREWFRRERGTLPASLDLVVIARKRAAQLDTVDVFRSLDRLVSPLVKNPENLTQGNTEKRTLS
ncbi:MAG: ribonuclease P protein component [Myxococcota bacterium]